MQEITEQLIVMKDEVYKNFHGKLMPTINPDSILGVRVPLLRKFSNQLNKNLSKEEIERFMNELPHRYYEENNLHAFMISSLKDFNETVERLNVFLPFVDNWATCDMMNPKVLGKYPDKLENVIMRWINDKKTYTVRYGIGLLMRYFLDESFDVKYLEIVSQIRSNEYYVNMMKAWFFAMALCKQYEYTLPYLENKKLDETTHNMTIRKAIESFRITNEQKDYIRTLKTK